MTDQHEIGPELIAAELAVGAAVALARGLADQGKLTDLTLDDFRELVLEFVAKMRTDLASEDPDAAVELGDLAARYAAGGFELAEEWLP